VSIVASEATRDNLIQMGMKRVKDQLDAGPGQIADLKKRIAAATDATAKAQLEDELKQQEAYLAEIRSLDGSVGANVERVYKDLEDRRY
jgi:hypothetical protein